jgi:Spy/CpxP family protein refolding chaperone
MRYLTTLVAFGLLLGAPELGAQQHQHHGDTAQRGMMGQGRGMMGQDQDMMPGMAIQAFAPEQLLSQRAELGLTDDQGKRLEQLQADAKREHDQAMASHDTYRDQMMEALQADTPDPTKIRGLMAGAHESMGQAHWAEMQAALQAMSVLTDAQRAQVRKAPPGTGMQHRHGQGRQ